MEKRSLRVSDTCKYQKGGCKGDEVRLSLVELRARKRREWTQSGTEVVPFEHQETLLCCAGDQALAQFSLRDYGVSICEELQKSSGHNHGQSAVGLHA